MGLDTTHKCATCKFVEIRKDKYGILKTHCRVPADKMPEFGSHGRDGSGSIIHCTAHKERPKTGKPLTGETLQFWPNTHMSIPFPLEGFSTKRGRVDNRLNASNRRGYGGVVV